MSFESGPGHEHMSEHVEYEMVADELRARFEDAVVKQAIFGDSFRMFTLVEPREAGSEPLARFRIMEKTRAELDLRSGRDNWTIDVALPIATPDISMPQLSLLDDYFVAFVPREAEEGEDAVVVRAETAGQDLDTLRAKSPYFMARILSPTTVIPMKKGSS